MPKGNNRAQNNRANQMNPNNAAYQSSRAGSGQSKAALDNRSAQLSTNHGASKPAQSAQVPARPSAGREPGE